MPKPWRLIFVSLVVLACAGGGHVVSSSATGRPAVRAAEVVARVAVRVLGVATYCRARLGLQGAGEDRLVPCRPGQGERLADEPRRLVEISFIARRDTDRLSWYSWNFQAPQRCPRASQGGPTWQPVRSGTRLIFDVLIPPACLGTARATAFYFTESSHADAEHGTLVGRQTVRLD
jgi:hypothetical protein